MKGIPMNRAVRIVCVMMLAWAAIAIAEEKPQSPPPHRKILFFGNSITLHGPAPKIGWTGNWGMAASAPENDYVHLITKPSPSVGRAPEIMVRNIALFERNYATFDVEKQLQDAFDFGADLVIVAIGENVPKLDSDEAKTQFAAGMGKLMHGLKAKQPRTIVVRSCFWPNREKDEILKKSCQEVGGIFVDIGGLSQDPSNYARSEREFENKGVGNHPGDKGMQAIADAILKAIGGH